MIMNIIHIIIDFIMLIIETLIVIIVTCFLYIGYEIYNLFKYINKLFKKSLQFLKSMLK